MSNDALRDALREDSPPSIQPVILAGGSGTRLWPASRQQRPKQFLKLLSEHSLLQQTLLRCKLLHALPPIVLGSEEHRFLIAEQAREIDVELTTIILEPVARSTAPAIALAAELSARSEANGAGISEPILLVLSSDHAITDDAAFAGDVEVATREARDGAVVTFGIPPTRAETAYGYIEAIDTGNNDDERARPITRFVEKPDAATAERYLSSGQHFWNSGMFAFTASAYLGELTQHQPSMQASCEKAMDGSSHDLDFVRPGNDFSACETLSIDYAVMEHTQRGKVIPASFGWNDVGTWDAVQSELSSDGTGLASIGDVVSRDSCDSLIVSDHPLVATIGLRNTIVVATRDAVLVADRARASEVKEIVAELSDRQRAEATTHLTTYRPWGSYENIEVGEGYQVKLLSVRPGGSLSDQSHRRRSEHWVVVAGTATVERDGETLTVSKNESIYIPVGSRHRLRNLTAEALELIEVQVGDYLGEDDIKRFDDVYGRP